MPTRRAGAVRRSDRRRQQRNTTRLPGLVATGGAAAGHIDLLTVVEHELGHIIGLPDTGGPGVMEEALDTGERRLPDASDVALSLRHRSRI
jgi:hypothetical protein